MAHRPLLFHPGFTKARAESHGGATSHVPELLMVEWVYEVPQVRSSEPLPVISPFQINCNRSLQTSTAEEAKERTLTLDSILLPWTSNLRNVVADEQHENIRGDCIRNVSVCGGHGLLFSRRRVSAVPSVGARIRLSCLARPAPHRHQQCALRSPKGELREDAAHRVRCLRPAAQWPSCPRRRLAHATDGASGEDLLVWSTTARSSQMLADLVS